MSKTNEFKNVDKNLFATTDTKLDVRPDTYKEICEAVNFKYTDWKSSRQSLEEDWVASWAEYFSNSRSSDYIRQTGVIRMGDVQTDWRHKIPTGKAFELVEDANSYLQEAFFPNKQWFDIRPKQPINDPEWEELIQVITKYIGHKLDSAKFQDWWDLNTRQALITGTSCLALPWRYDVKVTNKNRVVTNSAGQKEVVKREETQVVKNGLDLEVVDMFDFYLDPYALDANNANCIRKFRKSKAELINLVEDKVYPLCTKKSIIDHLKNCGTDSDNTSKADKIGFTGTLEGEYNPTDKVTILEYWGDLHLDGRTYFDVCVTVVDNILLDFKPNPFWGGKPFVITTLIPLQDSPYGLGLLSPILGQLHQMFVTQNHRLDCSELVINPMWLVVNDGTIDMSDLYSQPAKIIQVGDLDNIRQLEFSTSNLGVSIQDENLLEQRVERVTGINPYVGQGMGRDAERVTAEEVQSKREAGGTRLGRYHKHMESSALMEVLRKAYLYMQQFVIDDETIRIDKSMQGTTTNSYEFITVGAEELENDLDVVPVGSDWVIDKEREIRERIDFVSLVSQHPEMSQMINYEEVLKDIARRLVKQDWERYLKLGQQQQMPMGMSPEQGMPPEAQGQVPPEVLAQMQQQQPHVPNAQIPYEQQLAEGMPPDVQQFIQQAASNPQTLKQIVEF